MAKLQVLDHQLIVDDRGVHRCTVCGQTWATDIAGQCPGAPIYRWDPWPEGMFTRKQLSAKGLVPGPLAGVIPYDKSADKDGWLRLYREAEATPKPAPSAKRQAAIEKMKAAREAARRCRHCGRWLDDHERGQTLCDRCDASRYAQKLIATGDFVVWDSETTDLDGRFVEIAVIDAVGRTLFDRRVRPRELCTNGAYGVHGIRDEELASEPEFYEIYDALRQVLDGRRWVIYNADFDMSILRREISESEYYPHYVQHPICDSGYVCAMILYAQYAGDWRGRDRGYRWEKLSAACEDLDIDLPQPAHSALGDCLRTLEVIYKMANWYTER